MKYTKQILAPWDLDEVEASLRAQPTVDELFVVLDHLPKSQLSISIPCIFITTVLPKSQSSLSVEVTRHDAGLQCLAATALIEIVSSHTTFSQAV